MSFWTWAGLTLAGGLGAVARAVATHAVNVRTRRGFPFGTLAVNLSGALALGALSAAGASAVVLSVVGTGFLGAFTTFSTWMYETDHAIVGGHRARAALNVALSLAAGLLAVWLGRTLA
jgi:fluoride exporter